MRCSVFVTCASVATPWCSQLAMCWLEMRKRGAVFHQADVVDVRHLGAADALVDPAHHVAQDALALLSSSCCTSSARPVGGRPAGWSADRASCARGRGWPARPGARPRRPGGSAARAASRRWARAPRRCWRRPSGGRPSAPACPPCGRAPPTCPCRSAPAAQAAGEADIDVVVLIGLDPGGVLHVVLAHHRRRPPSRCGFRRRCGRGSRC